MVSIDKANCFAVAPTVARNLPNGIPSTNDEMTAANRQAVPEAA